MTALTSRRRIGYVLKMFPRLSETFVLNELLELERQGETLSIYSLLQPDDGRFHGRLGELRAAAEYVRGGKPENTWSLVRAVPPEFAVPLERWEEPADFLRRHRVAKELDVLLRAVQIATSVKRDGVEHLHAHFATGAARMAALAGMLADIPFSFTAHAKDIFSADVDRPLLAELIGRAAFVVTVSDFNRRFLLETFPGIEQDKLIRLYNGIDLDYFVAPRVREVQDRPHVVSVGRLVTKKGFDHLLRALRHARDNGLNFRATLVGDGPEAESLLALRRELDLEAEVAFPGSLPQEQVRRLLAESTLVALACVPDADGDMDALPTVLLEALASGVPIVATRLAGIPEIVGEDAGVLVDPGDDQGLARAIQALWQRLRRGDLGPEVPRARAERWFDLRRNVDTLRRRFSEATQSRAHR